jgi:hypothetical protein
MLEGLAKFILFFIPENLSIFLDGMVDKISISGHFPLRFS